MTSPTETGNAERKGLSAKLLGLCVILALAGGAGGFFAARSGVVPGLGEPDESPSGSLGSSGEPVPALYPVGIDDIAFVVLDPIVISLNDQSEIQHLRFSAQLEVNSNFQKEVEKLRPRIVDVLNSYLRALEIGDLRHPMALTKLRAQMLHRINVVVGEGRVRDLLVMEFVLN